MRRIILFYLLSWSALSAYADHSSHLDSLYSIAFKENEPSNFQFHIERAESVCSDIKSDQIKLFNFYYLFGYKLSALKSTERALNYYDKSLEIAVELEDLDRQRKCAVVISKLYQRIGHYQKAIAFTQEAHDLSIELKNDTLVARYMFDLGILNWRSNHVDKAILSLENALLMYSKLKDNHSASYVLMEMGICFDKVGRYQEAINYYDRSLALNNESKKLRSKLYNNYSRTYIALGDTATAFEMVKKAITLKKQINNMDMLVPAMNNLGVLYLKNQQIDSALFCFLEAYNLNSLSGDNGANAYEFKESFTYLDSIQSIKADKYLLVDLGVYDRYSEFIKWDVSSTELLNSRVARYEVDRVALRDQRRQEKNQYHWTIGIVVTLLLILLAKLILMYRASYIRKSELRREIELIEKNY